MEFLKVQVFERLSNQDQQFGLLYDFSSAEHIDAPDEVTLLQDFVLLEMG